MYKAESIYTYLVLLLHVQHRAFFVLPLLFRAAAGDVHRPNMMHKLHNQELSGLRGQRLELPAATSILLSVL